MKYAIYSDGSYKNGIWGAGAVILQETPFGFNPVQELSFFGEDADGIRNVAGEIYGVLEALRLLFKINQSSRDVDSVTVYHAIEIGQRTDDLLWVQYKDGSHYCISEEGEEGKFKKINIEAIFDENDCTTMIWGKVDIYNIDDIDEKYSEENDDESKFWNVT